jgi:hypothetical protein
MSVFILVGAAELNGSVFRKQFTNMNLVLRLTLLVA